MKTTLNWTKLVTQGRAKAYGVPWSKEEENALKAGMTPEDVRAGLLTRTEVRVADKEVKRTGKTPLQRMKHAELVAKARAAGLEFDAEAATRADLIDMLEAPKPKKIRKPKKAGK